MSSYVRSNMRLRRRQSLVYQEVSDGRVQPPSKAPGTRPTSRQAGRRPPLRCKVRITCYRKRPWRLKCLYVVYIISIYNTSLAWLRHDPRWGSSLPPAATLKHSSFSNIRGTFFPKYRTFFLYHNIILIKLIKIMLCNNIMATWWSGYTAVGCRSGDSLLFAGFVAFGGVKATQRNIPPVDCSIYHICRFILITVNNMSWFSSQFSVS